MNEWYKERVGKHPLSKTEQKRIEEDFEALAHKSFAESFPHNCPNKHNDALIIIIKMGAKTERGGYTLKRGIVINKNGKLYTNKNLTAAVAEWYIAQDLTHRGDFIAMAKDWDDYEF